MNKYTHSNNKINNFNNISNKIDKNITNQEIGTKMTSYGNFSEKNQRVLPLKSCPVLTTDQTSSDSLQQQSDLQNINRDLQQPSIKQQTSKFYSQYSRRNYTKPYKVNNEGAKLISYLTQRLFSDQDKSSYQFQESQQTNRVQKEGVILSSNQNQNQLKNIQNLNNQFLLNNQNVNQRNINSNLSNPDKNKSGINLLKMIKEKAKKNSNNKNKPKTQKIIEKESNSQKQIKKLDKEKGFILNETLVARRKLRQKTRKISINSKYVQFLMQPQTHSLLLNSKQNRSSSMNEIQQKIDIHLQILNNLPMYVKQFKNLYEDYQCWEQLMFLVYKKYYIQRKKVELSLSILQPEQSPYNIGLATVTIEELKDFNSSLKGINLQQKIRIQNSQIKNALHELYNHIIQKSGRYINILEQDNFQSEIFKLIYEQIQLLKQQQDDTFQSIRQRRINTAIKNCLLIAFLNNYSVQIQPVLMEGQLTQQQLNRYDTFINNLL